MTLRSTVFNRITTFAGTSAIIGQRCYPDEIPEKPTYPLIVYRLISADDSDYRAHDSSPVERETARVQFDCYDQTGTDAAALADQVVLAWSGYRSNDCAVGYAFQAGRVAGGQNHDLQNYREIVDVLIEHEK